MATSVHCWEFTNCGHHPGGHSAVKEGICPVTQTCGGDAKPCWSVMGTLCRGSIQSQFTEKLGVCLSCPYFQHQQSHSGTDKKLFKAAVEYRPPGAEDKL